MKHWEYYLNLIKGSSGKLHFFKKKRETVTKYYKKNVIVNLIAIKISEKDNKNIFKDIYIFFC